MGIYWVYYTTKKGGAPNYFVGKYFHDGSMEMVSFTHMNGWCLWSISMANNLQSSHWIALGVGKWLKLLISKNTPELETVRQISEPLFAEKPPIFLGGESVGPYDPPGSPKGSISPLFSRPPGFSMDFPAEKVGTADSAGNWTTTELVDKYLRSFRSWWW